MVNVSVPTRRPFMKTPNEPASTCVSAASLAVARGTSAATQANTKMIKRCRNFKGILLSMDEQRRHRKSHPLRAIETQSQYKSTLRSFQRYSRCGSPGGSRGVAPHTAVQTAHGFYAMAFPAHPAGFAARVRLRELPEKWTCSFRVSGDWSPPRMLHLQAQSRSPGADRSKDRVMPRFPLHGIHSRRVWRRFPEHFVSHELRSSCQDPETASADAGLIPVRHCSCPKP